VRLYRCEMEKFIQTTKLKLSNCNWLAANVNTYLIKDNQEAIVFWLALNRDSGSHEYWWGLRRRDVLVWTMVLPLAPDNTREPGSPWSIGGTRAGDVDTRPCHSSHWVLLVYLSKPYCPCGPYTQKIWSFYLEKIVASHSTTLGSKTSFSAICTVLF